MILLAHLTPNEFPLGTVLFFSGFAAGLVSAFVLGRLSAWRAGSEWNTDSLR